MIFWMFVYPTSFQKEVCGGVSVCVSTCVCPLAEETAQSGEGGCGWNPPRIQETARFSGHRPVLSVVLNNSVVFSWWSYPPTPSFPSDQFRGHEFMHPASLQSPAIHFPVTFSHGNEDDCINVCNFSLLLVNPGNRLRIGVQMFIGG